MNEQGVTEAVAVGIVLFWIVVLAAWGCWGIWRNRKKPDPEVYTTYENPIHYIRADCGCDKCQEWVWNHRGSLEDPYGDGEQRAPSDG